MSILIKDMEMPKTGAYMCELGVLDENTAVLTICTPIDEIQKSYKLIRVPPHGRLIDADDVNNHILGFVDLRDCPTILEAEEATE